MSKSKIAICLFQEFVTDFSPDNIIAGQKLVKVPFTGEIPNDAVLYQRKSELNQPAWVDIVSNFGELQMDSLKSASCGAILFLKINGRILGCCFGTSVANINRDNIETDFGLGVVYQKMTNSQTKTIESYSLAHNPITNNRSSSIPTSRNSFGLDKYLENITQLSGYFYDKSKRTLIKGKEFFSVTSPVSLDSIVKICQESILDYNKSINDEDFKRLTATRRVKDSKIIDILEKEMNLLLSEKSKEVYLVDYESYDNLYGYRFTPKAKEVKDDILIDDVYNIPKNDKIITVDYLKRKRIYPVDDTLKGLGVWNLYKCLFAEIQIGADSFILFKGNWYEIDSDYLSSLREFIKKFEVDIEHITPWNGTDSEGDFNEKVAIEIGGQCWDKKLYFSSQYNYGIEFCDILDNNLIYHVKKYSGSQLTSHLLMQTTVSAQLLASDFEIRKWLKDKSKEFFKGKNILLKRNLDFRKKQQTYCILLMSQRDGQLSEILPFFTMITLHLTIKRVTQLGFGVAVAKI